MIIAIDGLSANGKTTLAKMLSDKLNFKNFSTGAIYRCIAYEIINKKLDINNLEKALKSLKDIKIDFIEDKVILNNEDVTKKIRTEEITYYSTEWGTYPKMKEFVRKIQKDFLEKNDTVIEGRDICTRVAPNAEVKFYLYSDFEIRVKRLSESKKITLDEARNNLKLIDEIDINGGNFIKPQDATQIDTSNKNLDEVYKIMMENISKKYNIFM